MDDFAGEQWGDPDDRYLEHLKRYGHLIGSMQNGDQWELWLWHEGDDAKGRDLIEIKGVKLWHKITSLSDLPPLPPIPFPPYE